MSNQDLVDFAKDTKEILHDFHLRILDRNILAKNVYDREILGLVYAKDIIDELVRRLGCYIEDQKIWLSYNQVNQTKPDNLAEK
jgi:hypothetical protein